jgi:hypothetical protein
MPSSPLAFAMTKVTAFSIIFLKSHWTIELELFCITFVTTMNTNTPHVDGGALVINAVTFITSLQ